MELTSEQIIWFSFGFFLIISEMFTGALYMLILGLLALLMGVLVYLVHTPLVANLFIYAILGFASVFVIKKTRVSPKNMINLDQHQHFISSENLKQNQEGFISYQGTQWSALNAGTEDIQKGDKVEIIKTEGIKIIIKKINA